MPMNDPPEVPLVILTVSEMYLQAVCQYASSMILKI